VFAPTPFDFASENNRSNGTDIVAFGNDLLSGTNKTKTYKDVVIAKYKVRRGIQHLDVKFAVLQRIRQLRSSGNRNWSLAVLVPSRQLMLDVSDVLGQEQVFASGSKLPVISHEVAFEASGPALAGVLVSGLLEGSPTATEIATRMIQDLCAHMRGRKGNDTVAQAELQLAGALDSYIGTGTIRGQKRKNLINECLRIASTRHTFTFSGDPWQDWLALRRLLADSSESLLQRVAEDAKYLRLLHKGALLSSDLSALWRATGTYKGAVARVRAALLQEHFSASTRQWTGINVMTIHKSKGKEFDEVIIYEGCHQGRIIRINATERDIAQARLALRVAVTRAMKRSTILTPAHAPCAFL
jgi:DNA helicase-2/ATP-dependent DNA helicase PcrA